MSTIDINYLGILVKNVNLLLGAESDDEGLIIAIEDTLSESVFLHCGHH